MNNQLSIEALETLINAVEKYQEELEENKNKLINASNICDQAMGSDAISKKHIAALNNAIKELEKTSKIAENVAVALKDDLEHVRKILEN